MTLTVLNVLSRSPTSISCHANNTGTSTSTRSRTIVALSTHPIFREMAALPGGMVAETNPHPVQGCSHFSRSVNLTSRRNETRALSSKQLLTLQYYRDPNVINLRATWLSVVTNQWQHGHTRLPNYSTQLHQYFKEHWKTFQKGELSLTSQYGRDEFQMKRTGNRKLVTWRMLAGLAQSV